MSARPPAAHASATNSTPSVRADAAHDYRSTQRPLADIAHTRRKHAGSTRRQSIHSRASYALSQVVSADVI